MSKIEHYTTDGRLVKSSSGGYMGIFSTVSVLNDKEVLIDKLKTCLIEIADEDFRGNRSSASVKAFQLLKELGIKK